ncbi:AraC family transcriptional regulator [Anaeromicropila herbilytica]|uniref:Putative HTH-type transcriptional regulator YdeC n=1 Tax=Anaeromicropila herbilytica TaxID=2785025 RepID=A0A7R7EJN3_9FIRM|nr:AraC family transcriptional regulator [Anaeromicropila herbilytica]BCN29954.1 putative HTH-type transcriptional regulator YdeC [Anaeromicropila herbilytica]
MNYYQEEIKTDSIIPAKIYIGDSKGGNCHYPMHWHNNLEFNLVLEGSIQGKINGKHILTSKGDIFFVNSGDLHETDADDKNIMKAITILLSYDLLKEYCKEVDSYYFDLSEDNQAKQNVIKLILECATLYQDKPGFYELELSIALRKICSILLKECSRKRQDVNYNRYDKKSIHNLKKAITYMENHYTEEITLQSVAEEVGMAPTYFSRFMRKTTDETFYSYLTKIRLYHAYIELLNSEASITEIAMNNGFMNVKSFIEYFKKVYQETPARYRNKYKNGETI